MEELEPNPFSDHTLGWKEESMSSFLTWLFNDPHDAGDFSGDSFWANTQNFEQELINSCSHSSFSTKTDSITSTPTLFNTSSSPIPAPADSLVSNTPESLDLPKKKKSPGDPNPKESRKPKNRTAHDLIAEQGPGTKKPAANKKGNKSSRNNNNNNNKDARWAEQLLNPCAAAITSRNLSRVQHFFYVLHDLASLNGDANHRLAFHGLRALVHHVSAAPGSVFPSTNTGNTFASSNPKFFQDSLIKFNDISPWFRIPNNVANTSILQILGEQNNPTNLHILDIGISHGVQWPMLLEELTRRPSGPPPLVRLTVVTPPTNHQSGTTTPFVNGPPDYDFSSKLLSFAKDMNINLEINKLKNFQLHNLNSQAIKSLSNEILVICTQFRMHDLNHCIPDDRTELLRVLRGLQPKGVILSENNTDCSCNNCGDFTTGFSRKVEYLWWFLDSTSVAYKGRESDERRMMEAEAAKVLVNVGEMNERKEKWCARMKEAGFKGEVFGEETINGAKTLLRKYDSNWEIQVEEKDGCIGLSWKGQPVMFCSLWKINTTENLCFT